jgi:hypothetical protein
VPNGQQSCVASCARHDAGLHTHLRTLDIRFTRQLAGGGCEVVENAG